MSTIVVTSFYRIIQVAENEYQIITVGQQGPPGVGVPSGGTAGQVLTKDSNTNFDTSWQDATGGTGDHAELTHLDYASAAHTDFAGTKVPNTFTKGQSINPDTFDASSPCLTLTSNISALNAIQVYKEAGFTQSEAFTLKTDGEMTLNGTVKFTPGTVDVGSLTVTVPDVNDEFQGDAILRLNPEEGYRLSFGVADVMNVAPDGGTIVFGPLDVEGLITGTAGALVQGATQLTPGSASVVPVKVKGAASQTANLQEWQDNSGSALLSIQNNGTIHHSGIGNLDAQQYLLLSVGGNARCYVTPEGEFHAGYQTGGGELGAALLAQPNVYPAKTVIVAKGTTSQTGDLQQWQDDTGTVLGKVNATGQATLSPYRTIGVPLTIQTPATRTVSVTGRSLTSNVATLTTSTAHGFIVGESITVFGVNFTFNGAFTITAIPSSTTLSYAKTASNVGFIPSIGSVAAQQTNPITAWKDDTGTTVAQVSAQGHILCADLQVNGGNVTAAGVTGITVAGSGADITNLNMDNVGSGVLGVGFGGTGQTSASAAINALVPSQSGQSGKVLGTNGTAVSWVSGGGGGGSTIGSGAYSSLPSAGTAGNCYISTNSPLFLRDNGTTWVPFGPLYGPYTKPVASDFPTQVGFIASTSVTNTNGTVRLLDTGGQGNAHNYAMCLKSVTPGASWTMTMAFTFDQMSNQFPQVAIIMRDSVSGKFGTYGFEFRPQQVYISECVLNYSSPTTYTGTSAAGCWLNGMGLYFLQVVCDGTNVFMNHSVDFVHWTQYRGFGIAGWYVTSIDQVGYGIDPYGSQLNDYTSVNILHAVCA